MKSFEGIRYYPLLQLGLSQMYLNEEKVNSIEQWFDPDDISKMTPVPVHDFGNGQYTLTDGHSRVFVAYKYGLTHVPIVYDNDEMIINEIGQRLYHMDIEWCKRFHLNNISDLSKRILPNEDYIKFWIERCQKSYNLLSQTTVEEQRRLQDMETKLYLFGASENLLQLFFEDREGNLYIL